MPASNPQKEPVPNRIAVIASEAMLGRLSKGLSSCVRPGLRLWPIPFDRSEKRLIQRLSEWRPRGIILEFEPTLIDWCLGAGVPVVVLMADLLSDGVGCVVFDDDKIGELAANYLTGLNLPHFAWVDGENELDSSRRESFELLLKHKGLRSHGLHLKSLSPTWRSDYIARPDRQLLDWLSSLPKPVGILALQDSLGWMICEACQMLNLRMPEDVSLLALSYDSERCEWTWPGISTVEFPWAAMARQSVEMLSGQIEHNQPLSTCRLPPTRISPRASSAYVSGGSDLLKRALAHIRQHACSGLTVKELVSALASNRRSLERAFRDSLNRSPHQILVQTQLANARNLLEDSHLPIARIAENSGFPSPEAFSRTFRKHHHTTPRQWRQQHRS